MRRARPKECVGCPLYSIGSGFMEPEGTGTNGVMIVGEALGEQEARDGLPFRPSAPAGHVLETAIRNNGTDRQQYVLTNIVRCFASHRTTVLTSIGPVELYKCANHLVMTRSGEFRAVQSVIHNKVRSKFYKVTYEVCGNLAQRPVSTMVTEDHRFLVDDEWSHVPSLKVGDRIRCIAERCCECGSVFTRHHYHQFRSIPFCSNTCHNRFAARKGIDKMRASMLESYRMGKRDPYAITKAANVAFRALLNSGWRTPKTDEGIARQRIRAALTRQAFGLSNNYRWIGHGESVVAQVLESAGHEYTSQFALDGYNYDFKVGNVLVEVDGNGQRLNTTRKQVTALKDALAESHGYKVVHVSNEHPQEVLNLLDNDNHEYVFSECKVVSIDGPIERQGSWTLAVEGDHSYIGHGTVSHNCQPPRNELLGAPYAHAAINHCKVHFRKDIERFQPKVIVAAGAIATRTLTQLTGQKMRLEDLQGFALEAPEYPGVRVIPTYHPSYIQRGAWQVFPLLRLALARATQLAKDGWQEPNYDFAENATVNQIEELAEYLEENPHVDLNVDVETDGGEMELPEDGDEEDEEEAEVSGCNISTNAIITQFNFSISPDTGYAIEFTPDTQPVIQRALATQNPKNGHNFEGYDRAVLKYNNLFINGRVDDTMLMFHHLNPDLPGSYKKLAGDTVKEQGSFASLQFCASFYGAKFPWKHLRLERGDFYGCLDGANGILVYQGAKREMEKMGVWESYDTFVRRLRPILADAERRGIPVNRKKLQEFIAFLMVKEEEKKKELYPLIPQDLRPSKQKFGLKRVPKSTEGLVLRTFHLEEAERCGCVKTVRGKVCSACLGSRQCLECGSTGKTPSKYVPDANCLLCKGSGELKGDVRRWCELKDFNANSHVQMKEYANYRHHRIPKNSKRKYAMDKETLERLEKSTGDPVYRIVREAKAVTKMRGTYGEGWLKRTGSDDCVHTQFLFLPATGQLSSSNPNIQNTPHPVKQGEYATRFRDAIEAKPGHVLIEADYRSFHAQTLAWEAKDWQYLRLAKLDAHSYLTGYVKRIEGYRSALGWDDEKLKAWLKVIKKTCERERNEKYKPALLGWGFGLGGTRLYNSNPDAFSGVREAMGVFDALDAAFPITAEYRRQSPEKAHQQKYLKSAFDCIRWFWNVKIYDFRSKSWEHGMDWDRSIAFRPANDAFCHKKLALLRCREKEYTERYGFINDIHDSFVFHCREELAEECIHNVKMEMEAPSEVMKMPTGEGFSVEVEVKVGKTWAAMEEVKA